jgi:hypothetical protein
VTPPVRVLFRRGAIVRVESTAAGADAQAYLRGVADAIGLTGVDAEAWIAAVAAGGAGLIGLKLRDQAAIFHELDMVVLTRAIDSVQILLYWVREVTTGRVTPYRIGDVTGFFWMTRNTVSSSSGSLE